MFSFKWVEFLLEHDCSMLLWAGPLSSIYFLKNIFPKLQYLGDWSAAPPAVINERWKQERLANKRNGFLQKDCRFEPNNTHKFLSNNKPVIEHHRGPE